MTNDAPTTTDAASPAPTTSQVRSAGAAAFARGAAAWHRIEPWLASIGDRLNPILVKETRQSLKSWQFTLTFVLLLVTCWVVTIGGVAWVGPSIYYAAAGGSMLLAYYVLLAGLLIVFVPYSAFRSLTAEREDNTYELLSITTLRSRQIISGKLGSAVAQMLVYFSAITPCLAFTYLLRGVDLPTIVLLLVYTFLVSLALSLLGLVFGALQVQKFGQAFLAVGFVGLLLMFLVWTIQAAFMMITTGYVVVSSSEFWIANLAIATAYVTTFALVYYAAAALISFPSENRSTPLRLMMVVQQTAWIGWIAYLAFADNLDEVMVTGAAVAGGAYWYLMGSMLTGERPEMSRRARRDLPQSLWGRALFTWLFPGPASGYMFVVANLTAIAFMYVATLFSLAALIPTAGNSLWTELFALVILGWSYLVAYLGLGRLLITVLRRVAKVTMLAAVLINFLLLLAGSGIPMIIQMMSVDLRKSGYTLLQVTNPFYTLYTVARGELPSDATVPLMAVPAAAVCVLLLNLPAVVRELQQVRVAAPQRVLDDDAELLSPPPGPSSPWDTPEQTA